MLKLPRKSSPRLRFAPALAGSWVLLASVIQADIPINAGLSGSWYNPETSGQGVLIDIIPQRGMFFAGWFTYNDSRVTPDSDPGQQWMTLQGPYDGTSTNLVVYRTSGGVFNQSSEVSVETIGFASMQFHTCTTATMVYELDGGNQKGIMPLTRLSPDEFCQEIVDSETSKVSTLNFPPHILTAAISSDAQTLEISYSVEDAENDPLDVRVELLGDNGVVYKLPEASLDGHAGFPVLQGSGKSIRWSPADDAGYATSGITQFQVRLVIDDRYTQTLQDIVNLVRRERLVRDVQALEGVRHHQADPVGLADARNYIKDAFLANKLQPQDQFFTWQGSQGVNIVATLPGPLPSEAHYMVVAHYDSVTTTPGADDNASGTAGVLEAMRVLSQFNTLTGVRFVAFDKEELGLRGSRHYAANISPDEDILGLINFEMIGYTCRSQPGCQGKELADTAIYNISSRFDNSLSDSFIDVGESQVPGLKIISTSDDGDPNLRRSDHAPFWDIGVDALFLTDGANFRTPHYHQPSDTLETMDTEFMTQIVQTAVGTIAKLTGAHHTAVWLSEPLTLD